jgi:hypothetical protein
VRLSPADWNSVFAQQKIALVQGYFVVRELRDEVRNHTAAFVRNPCDTERFDLTYERTSILRWHVSKYGAVKNDQGCFFGYVVYQVADSFT